MWMAICMALLIFLSIKKITKIHYLIACIIETLLIYMLSSTPNVKNVDWLSADLFIVMLGLFLIIFFILNVLFFFIKKYRNGFFFVLIFLIAFYLIIEVFVLERSCN